MLHRQTHELKSRRQQSSWLLPLCYVGAALGVLLLAVGVTGLMIVCGAALLAVAAFGVLHFSGGDTHGMQKHTSASALLCSYAAVPGLTLLCAGIGLHDPMLLTLGLVAVACCFCAAFGDEIPGVRRFVNKTAYRKEIDGRDQAHGLLCKTDTPLEIQAVALVAEATVPIFIPPSPVVVPAPLARFGHAALCLSPRLFSTSRLQPGVAAAG